MRPALVVPGERFFSWTVIREVAPIPPHRYIECLCVCGATGTPTLNNLRRGKSQSCGCKSNITHGLSKSSEYHIWQQIKERCLNPDSKAYPYYGGRGITIHSSWAKSFEEFLSSVGRRPSADLTLDRIDNNGNYEPGNVRWATRTVQQRNKSTSRKIGNESLADIAERVGITPSGMAYRLRAGADGFDIELPSNRNGNRYRFSGGGVK